MYEAAGGDEGLLRLAAAWHARVMSDEEVSHAFRHGFHPHHGDETWVVRLHSGNGEHEEMDRRALACFDQAMTDVGLDDSNPARKALHEYFAWALTNVSRFPRSADDVPAGLRIPQWSWNGPPG